MAFRDEGRDVVGPSVVGLVFREPDVVDLDPRTGREDRPLEVQAVPVAQVADDDPLGRDTLAGQQRDLLHGQLAVVRGVGRDGRVGRDAGQRRGTEDALLGRR